jgi:mannose-1-phosphate guanylyltransferase
MPLGLEGAPSGRAVVEFVEKPDAARAEAYLASGEFRWNAGMFVVKASVLLALVEQWHPTMAAGVRALAADGGRLDEVWPTLTKIAIDHAVAEPAAAAGRVAVVPATFGWDDVGDFDSLAGLLEAQTASAASPAAAGVSLIGDPADLVTVDSSGLVVSHSGRLVALIGVEDLVVVDTPGALLVVPRARAQEVKAVVDRLAALGRDDLR